MATQAQPTSKAKSQTTRKKAKPGTPFAGAIPMAIIGLLATAIGFFPTFFSRLHEVDVAHLVHGWTMTGWLGVVMAQALLIRSRKYKLHHILGWTSLALFALMVASSCQMMVMMLSGSTGLPFEMAQFFAYSDIMDMPLLFLLFGGAIVLRKNRHMHSRMIAATVLTSIVPALARMFNILIWRSMEGLYHAMHPTYLLILGVLGTAIYVDRKNGRLRWPLPLTFVWFSFVYATQWVMMDAAWYNALTIYLASFA